MRRKKIKINTDFDKTHIVEKELIDKITLWILRIILRAGGTREFIDLDNRFDRDELAYFLDLGFYVESDSSSFTKSEIIDALRIKLFILENKEELSSSTILKKNIEQISSLMNLNETEEAILEFSVLIHQYDILEMAGQLLGNQLNTSQVKKVLSKILDIDIAEINRAFRSNAKLVQSSIVTINKNNTYALADKIEILSDAFADNMLNLDEDISEMIKDSVRQSEAGTLNISDYTHLQKDIDVLLQYLQQVLKTKQKGVNILFYGRPGTGKTELSRTISKVLQTELFEVSYADEDDEPIDGMFRLRAYKTAQALLKNKNIMLVYDEAEDVFDSSSSFFSPKRQSNKAWINKILESNTIPTIWITNNIDSIDNAIVRRFDFTLEVPIPNKKKRAQIIKNYSQNLLDDKSVEILAANENIAPALVSRASKVVSSVTCDDTSEVFTQVLNNTLKAQGYNEIDINRANSLPNVYNPNFIHTTTNLEVLTQGIKAHQNARLCFYGPAGTGKSAYGKYIAEILNKPLLLKKGSDLISMWVGGTEKNIAAAFKEAKEEDAVLIFDEVDSFLADRTQANQSWEVTQV
ncbi:AAA family ATPase, partial [Sulfurimonas sp.]